MRDSSWTDEHCRQNTQEQDTLLKTVPQGEVISEDGTPLQTWMMVCFSRHANKTQVLPPHPPDDN